MKEDRPDSLSKILLALAFVVFLGIALLETAIDRYCLFEDQSYIRHVADARQKIHTGRIESLFGHYHNYPPAFFVLSALVLPGMEYDRPAAGFLAWGWLALAMAGTFVWLRKKITKWPAFFAIAVFIASPCFRYAIKYLTIDLGLLAVFPWTCWALDRSESFKHTGWSILAGWFTALGVLMRHDFAVLALLPLGLHAWAVIRRPDFRSVANGLAFCLVIGALLVAFFRQTPGHEAGIAFHPQPWEYYRRAVYHPHLLFHVLFPGKFLLLAAGGLLLGFLIRPKTTGALLFFISVIVAFYSFFWLLFGVPGNFGDFLWNYKYMLIPTLLLCALAGFFWLVPSKGLRCLLPVLLLMTGLPMVPRDFVLQDPAPMGHNDVFTIRPVELLDSNLAPYRRLLRTALPHGGRIGIVDGARDPAILEHERNNLIVTKFMLAGATQFLEWDLRYQVKEIEPLPEEAKEFDGLLVPKGVQWGNRQDRAFPLVVSPDPHTDVVWYFILFS